MTQGTAPTPTASLSSDELDAHRAIAIDFLQQASTGHAGEAMQRYAAPDFVHHNPWFPGDAASLAKAMDENARSNPAKLLEILRTIAEGPLVVTHSRVRHGPEEQAFAAAHLFRIENGRIRELWDLAQPVPADSPNAAGMF